MGLRRAPAEAVPSYPREMRPRNRVLVVLVAIATLLLAALAAPGPSAAAAVPLPERMARTGGGTQLITAVTGGSTNASRDGVLTWWSKQADGHWTAVRSTPARFGVHGLSDNRVEGDGTTPTGIFSSRRGFGVNPNPGTKINYTAVTAGSWWNENSLDTRYNTWHQNCPPSVCWDSSKAHASEHLASHLPQYNYAVVVEFNTGSTKVRPPARPSGSGIFLHVFGTGHTAGCISISQTSMVALLRWLDPAKNPHIAIGNSVSILRF